MKFVKAIRGDPGIKKDSTLGAKLPQPHDRILESVRWVGGGSIA